MYPFKFLLVTITNSRFNYDLIIIFLAIACQQPTDQLIKIRLEIVGPDGLIVADSKHGVLASVKPEIPTTDRLVELFKKCLPGHYLFGRNCYSIKNDIQVLSYDLAQASCNSMEVIGSQPNLVSISTKDELDFVNSLIKTNQFTLQIQQLLNNYLLNLLHCPIYHPIQARQMSNCLPLSFLA